MRLACLSFLLCAAPALAGEVPHVALVVGTANYRALPPVASCAASASAVSAALRRAGWTVRELRDASNGQLAGALNSLADDLAQPAGQVGLIYLCGYATTFERRTFLLPSSAVLSRESDVLTAGVVVPSVTGALTQSPLAAGLVVLDMVAPPGADPVPPANVALRAPSAATGLLATSAPGPGPDAPSPAARALAAAMAAPPATVGELVERLGTELAPLGAFAQPPRAAAWLSGAPPAPPAPPSPSAPAAPAEPVVAPPPPSPPPPPPVPDTVAEPPAVPAAPAVTEAPPAPSQPAAPPAPAAGPPADAPAALSDLDRRQVQLALGRLGYYAGRVDGLFGAETIAAIRRFQHELGAAMTGRLTQAQAARLLAITP